MIHNNELLIFDNFIVDHNLPKHKKADKNTNSSISFGTSGDIDEWNTTVPVVSWDNPQTLIEFRKHEFSETVTIINWIKLQLAKFLYKDKLVKKKSTVLTVQNFFNQIKSSFNNIEHVDNIATYYEKVLIKAKSVNQTALVEKLIDNIEIIRAESSLINTDLNKYISESDIIELYKKVGEDKNLKLTWLKNFARIIPDDVYNAKLLADEKLIFDNYVILHYDPQNNGEKLTKQEIEKKKDPILFGVIRNSRKLYYIVDWTDEYCDLTLEQMVSILGNKVGEINNESVKTFINKIKG